MAKLKNPLLSLEAIGRLAKSLSLKRSRGINILEKKPIPEDVRSLAQLSWRHMYQKAVALWHALSAAEKQDWESQARSRHMTGFAWFMSQALKPNPGLYLPLQGGTMAGDIDMAKNRILKLPAPVDLQEAFRLSDYVTYVLPYLLREGAKVHHTAAQAIPHNTWTILAFNSERYDTDTIHDPVTNNSRLTCKTAGKYIISGQTHFEAAAAGIRYNVIYLNATTDIAYVGYGLMANDHWYGFVTTTKDLAVGDFVELKVLQSSGAPLNIALNPQFSPEFMMQRIGT